MRLPSAEGVAAVTVNAPVDRAGSGDLLCASRRADPEQFAETGAGRGHPLGNGSATIAQKGALLTAVASILRYHQNRGELRGPNGPATPAALNQFLEAVLPVDVNGTPVLRRLPLRRCRRANRSSISGGRPSLREGSTCGAEPDGAAAADVLQQGSPALLSLALFRNGAPAGGHFVVATGVAADGSSLIQDPSSYLARTSLSDYLRGFNAGGGRLDGASCGAWCSSRCGVRRPRGSWWGRCRSRRS